MLAFDLHLNFYLLRIDSFPLFFDSPCLDPYYIVIRGLKADNTFGIH